MKLKITLAGLAFFLAAHALHAQIIGDVLGTHNLGPGSKSPITGARPDSCAYCHAPHSGLNHGLWNQKLTTQVYTVYTSTTETNKGRQPILGQDSNLCLGCHDGTVAVGSTVAYGQVTMRGSMNPQDVLGSNLQTTHPFSLVTPLKDALSLVSTLASGGHTADTTGAVRLIRGNVECSSCHNAHVQAKDLVSLNFLAKDSSNGQLCLACHDPSRTASGQTNPLADWATSAHALSTSQISPSAALGSYKTVALTACISCHTPHNGGGSSRILRGQNESDCISCHNGANVSPMPQYANVFSEYGAGKVGHPFPNSNNPHDANEVPLLNNNRHATCVDCHSSHGSQQVGVFPSAPLIRISQKDVIGVSAIDGTTIQSPAINQFESCFRCHGVVSGKQTQTIYGYFPNRAISDGDQLNLIPQFAVAAKSSHPVTHPRSSADPQPSLLANMLQLDGTTAGRSMGTQILCTDCHNSDDNREFGGNGPNGPHGSKWTHILERRYEFSQATTPGGTMTTLYQYPDLGVNGPYGLCAKCHDLANQVVKNTSFAYHSNHVVNDGLTCSTCHSAHGTGPTAGAITGEGLINFDLNVVAQNGANPVSYDHGSQTCVLVCHNEVHNPGGGVAPAVSRSGPIQMKK